MIKPKEQKISKIDATMLSVINASWIFSGIMKIGTPSLSIPSAGGSLTIKYTTPVWRINIIINIILVPNNLVGIGKDSLGILNLGNIIFGFLSLFPKIQGVFLFIFSNIVSDPVISSLFFRFSDIFCFGKILLVLKFWWLL